MQITEMGKTMFSINKYLFNRLFLNWPVFGKLPFPLSSFFSSSLIRRKNLMDLLILTFAGYDMNDTGTHLTFRSSLLCLPHSTKKLLLTMFSGSLNICGGMVHSNNVTLFDMAG